jgi:hypothetical protein
LRKILNEISFGDLLNLSKTPEVRKLVLQFFSNESNFRDLEKRVVLECIDQLEEDLETNLFLELIEFFETKGYRDFRTLPAFQRINKEFLKELFVLEPRLLQEIDEIDFNIEDFEFQIRQKKLVSQQIKRLIQKYRNKMDEIEEKEILRFKKLFFKGPKSYENIKEYLEQVNQYLEIYMKSKNELSIKSAFYRCIQTKLEIIHRLFDQS